MPICCQNIQAFSGLDEGIAKFAKLSGNTALDAALNAQFLVQIGVFTAVPMIVGFILESGLLKVSPSDASLILFYICTRSIRLRTVAEPPNLLLSLQFVGL